MPTGELAELESIVDVSQGFCGGGSWGEPCIDPIFGPTAAFGTWSASTVAIDPGDAWNTHFNYGGTGTVGKIDVGSVRAVRSGS